MDELSIDTYMWQETSLMLFPPPWVWRLHSSEPKGCKYYNAGKQWLNDDGMMALLNGNIFHVTGPLCGNSLDHIVSYVRVGSSMNFTLDILSDHELRVIMINTLRSRPYGRYFADDIFKCILLNENVWIPIKISLKFVPKDPINNIPAFVQIMAWRRLGDKPLYESMMVSLSRHICDTRPQWVNTL